MEPKWIDRAIYAFALFNIVSWLTQYYVFQCSFDSDCIGLYQAWKNYFVLHSFDNISVFSTLPIFMYCIYRNKALLTLTGLWLFSSALYLSIVDLNWYDARFYLQPFYYIGAPIFFIVFVIIKIRVILHKFEKLYDRIRSGIGIKQ